MAKDRYIFKFSEQLSFQYTQITTILTLKGGIEMKWGKVFKNLCSLGGRLLLLMAVFFLFTTQPSLGTQWPKDLIAISPAPGASVHMVLVGMGKVIEKYTPIKHWIVQPLGGPKLWLPLMMQGKCDFANQSAPDILNAFLGRGAYMKMGPQPIRTVAAGHEYMFMFWTIPSKGIKTIADLKGKVVYYKFKANPMFTDMAKYQLASAGLSLKDLKAGLSFSSIKEAVRGLIEGRVDAILYPVVPGAVMQVNEAKGECLFIHLTKKQARFVATHMPGYTIEDIPANDPRFRNKSAVPNAICYQNAMFTRANMDLNIVYEVVKAIFDHSKEFADTHPVAKYWSLEYRPVTLAVPYHEGAIKYFKEKGLWTKEAEMYQKKLLKEQQVLLDKLRSKKNRKK